MKKFLIGLILGLFSFSVNADHETQMQGEVYFQNVPALCGTPEAIQAYTDHYDMKPVYISLGREGMKGTGMAVYMMTIMMNSDFTESMSVIDVPSGTERCILYHTFDLTRVDKTK
tara:strand:- start:968 stop:1312 length:345 start_codon:yes stop_codon:yes gene_type:complete